MRHKRLCQTTIAMAVAVAVAAFTMTISIQFVCDKHNHSSYIFQPNVLSHFGFFTQTPTNTQNGTAKIPHRRFVHILCHSDVSNATSCSVHIFVISLKTAVDSDKRKTFSLLDSSPNLSIIGNARKLFAWKIQSVFLFNF